MMLSRSLFALVPLASLLTATPAAAAPIPIVGDLPMTSDGVDTLRHQLTADEFERTMEFLGSLRVFEDDRPLPRPLVYLAPSFAADAGQDVIGGQTIATDLLSYLDDLDELLAAIGGSVIEFDRLSNVRDDYGALADQLIAMTDHATQAQGQALIDYAHNNPSLADLDRMPARITAAMNHLPAVVRSQIAAALVAAMDSLRVPLTPADRAQAVSDPVQFALGVPTRVRARLATMVLGVRYATFISGMTADQTRYLDHYAQMAAHATVAPLPIQVLRVLAIGSTFDQSGPLGDHASAPEMIRGVNASTNGVCGLTTQCTVLIEYTEIGARSALLSTRGASIMPAQFVGDVAVSSSAVIIPTACDIQALRQHLVLPFGIDLLGDREILRVIGTPGICRGATTNATNRLSSAIALSSALRTLLYDPAQLPVARRGQLPSELVGLLATTPSAYAALGSVATMVASLDLESFFDRLSRTLYTQLMPRFPDQLIAGLIVSSSAAAPPTTRFDFDGFPIVCWKKSGTGPYLSACLDSAPEPDLQDAVAAALEGQHCQQAGLGLTDCAAAIQAAPADADGFLWTDR
jgi:hypothetical protein